MTDLGKKVKNALEDVKDKTLGTSANKVDRESEAGYTSSTQSDPTKEYESAEPMSPAKIREHEPTAVKRENTETTKPTPTEDAKERLRRSGMTEGTAGST